MSWCWLAYSPFDAVAAALRMRGRVSKHAQQHYSQFPYIGARRDAAG
jgi:hypothetical protein